MTYNHILIQHLLHVYSCANQTHYGYSQLIDLLILYRTSYPTKFHQFLPHKKHVWLLLQMEALIDHKPLFHHLNSRNRHTLFPTRYRDKLQHDLHNHQHLQQGECHPQYKWYHLYNRNHMVKPSVVC